MPMNCVNCGRDLYDDRCKVRCPRCGYFEDCSDPGAPGEWAEDGRAGAGAAPDRREPNGGAA